jgi:hypothetical protein
MKSFRDDNTEGYTADELDSLNTEWETIVNDLGLEENTDEYDLQSKWFADRVAKR